MLDRNLVKNNFVVAWRLIQFGVAVKSVSHFDVALSSDGFPV